MSEDLRIRLLIVDDEQSIRKLCMTVGEALGFVCLEAESGEAALALLEEQPAHMILTDMVMPNMSGLEFLEQVKKMLPRTEVAVMTGHGSIETAVQAMKLGAYDYITKPFSPLEELRLFLRRMADKVRLVEENQFLRERAGHRDGPARHRRRLGQDPGRVAHDLAPERHAHARSDYRRERNRQRAGGARHPLSRIASPTVRLSRWIADRWFPR